MEVGDTVKTKQGKDVEGCNWAPQMNNYVGIEAEIIEIDKDGDMRLRADDCHGLDEWWWSHEWVDLIVEKYEAIGKIAQNEAGQILLEDNIGDSFDMSKYVGKTFYIKASNGID